MIRLIRRNHERLFVSYSPFTIIFSLLSLYRVTYTRTHTHTHTHTHTNSNREKGDHHTFLSNSEKSNFTNLKIIIQFSCSVMSNSLRPHEPQHARPPCPSLVEYNYKFLMMVLMKSRKLSDNLETKLTKTC